MSQLVQHVLLTHRHCSSKWTKITQPMASARVYGTTRIHSHPHPVLNPTRQIGCADVILLNKTDLCSEEEILSLEDRIRKVNPVAPLHRTVRGQIDLSLILGIGAYRTASQLSDSPATHTQPERPHLHTISALRLTCPTLNLYSLTKLDEWIRTLLWEARLPFGAGDHQLLVLRCKGYFQSETGAEYVLQGVRDLYELREVSKSPVHPTTAPDSGKLVLIGKGLDDDMVRQSFESLFVDRAPAALNPSHC